jgi:hypothetical protein
MSTPRSPITLRLLSALEAIYSDATVPSGERLQAATLAAKLLGAKRKPAKRKASGSITKTLEKIRQLNGETKND